MSVKRAPGGQCQDYHPGVVFSNDLTRKRYTMRVTLSLAVRRLALLSLRWRHINIMTSQITSNSTVCFTAHEKPRKRNLKIRITALCEGTSSVTDDFPAQMASNAKSFHWCHGAKQIIDHTNPLQKQNRMHILWHILHAVGRCIHKLIRLTQQIDIHLWIYVYI